MRDYTGKTLEIGDEVIMIEPNYRNFVTGFIFDFTPKMVRVKYKSSQAQEYDIIQSPQQLIKV